jgi:hydroxyethylthiazole kinase
VDIVASALLSIGCECLLVEEPLSTESYKKLEMALHINIGTMTNSTLKATIATIREARKAGVKWVFDPIAATLTDWRTDAVMELVSLQPSVITVNAAEAKMFALASGCGDVSLIEKTDFVSTLTATRSLARKHKCVVMCVDTEAALVTNGTTSLHVRDGHLLSFALRTMASGRTMLSAVCAAFIAACPEDELVACAHALAFVTVCFQSVMKRADSPKWGPKLRNVLLDEMFALTKRNCLAKPKIRDVHWTIMENTSTPAQRTN